MSCKCLKTVARGLGLVAAGIGVAIGAAGLGIAAYQRVRCADFYRRAQREFPIPGIHDGFVPQDICRIPGDGGWLLSGYDANGKESPLYKRSAEGDVTRIVLEKPDGTTYAGHGAAVAINGPHAYVTTENGCMVFALDEVLGANDGDRLQASAVIDFGLVPAFMSTDATYLYAGEYYYKKYFETPPDHRLTSPTGTHNPAILFAFRLDPNQAFGFDPSPAFALSIPAEVQGMCTTPEGRVVLSTSWGVSPSHVLVYDGSRIVKDVTFQGPDGPIPLGFLEPSVLVEDIVAPPMAEGIVSYADRVWLPSEAASSKYLFGRFYRAGWVFALKL